MNGLCACGRETNYKVDECRIFGVKCDVYEVLMVHVLLHYMLRQRSPNGGASERHDRRAQ